MSDVGSHPEDGLHANLIADLNRSLDVEAGLAAIVPATSFKTDSEPWWSEESISFPSAFATAVRRGASARVFVSHATEDRGLAEELYRQLVADGHQVFLDRDLRDDIVVSEKWVHGLHQRLQWADAMVCVATSDYLASRRCTAELRFARSRGSWLLPVQPQRSGDDPLLRSVTDAGLEPESVGAALVKTLRRVDDTDVLGWPKDRSPFPGLRPFDVDEHRVFFGCTGEVAQLVGLLRSVVERVEGAALLVVGPSGCGKSSLVRAGLVPVIADEPGWWTLPPIVPGADPVAALIRELAAAARTVGLDWTVTQVRHRLDEAGLTKLVDELLLAAPGRRRRLLVVIDQFEEMLTQATPAARARFAGLLRPALAGPVQMVTTLRPEFLNQLLGNPELATLPTRTFMLGPLRREALRTIIERPARLAGISVAEHLVTRLVEDTGSGEALPLLALTLAQLADGVSCGGQLSHARYDELGGMQGALTRQANAALTEAVAAGGRSRDKVITGLLRLVTIDELGRPTRQRVIHDDLPEPVAAEWEVFVTRRLLVTDTDNGNVMMGVAHEAFLAYWPPLVQAISAAAPALRARRGIEHAAAGWDANSHPPTLLWEGSQLAAAVADTGAQIGTCNTAPPGHQGMSRWLRRRYRVLMTDHVDLSPCARDFLHASIRHNRHRRRRISAVLSVLLILTLIAAGIAVYQQLAAEQAQRIATTRQLIAQADVARNTDLRIALKLSVAAQRIHPDRETLSSLINLLTNSRYFGALTGPTGPVNSMAFSPNGHTLATAGADQTVWLWDLTNPHRPAPAATLTGHTGLVNSVAFSPDGHALATANSDRTVQVWDVSDPYYPAPAATFTGRTGPVHGTALAPRNTVTGHIGPVYGVALAPGGHTLATASSDRTVTLWDLTIPARPRPLGPPLIGQNGVVRSVDFASNRRILAAGSDDGTTILWDLSRFNDLRDDAIARACSITGGGLNRDEWARYIPGLSYEKTCPSR
ncbi:MAG TPA: TIR domain-containing protein [Pseudonocardiaceae bacterium]|jgi:energy-coupling factor transporter ATP-binding protein EcfA2|nr:TIR domain-containing protein [Pseudonocardiaceae bacterium]